MPVIVSIASSRIEVVPGGSASVEVTLRNTGSVVDEFQVEVVGDASGWATASPSVVPLFPGATAQVVVTFAPLRSAEVPAGEFDAVVKVTSREDPDGGAAEEMVVVVGGYDQPGGELVPRTLRGARGAKAQLAIDNHGNRPTLRNVSATDADQLLRFSLDPEKVPVGPGQAAFVDLKVKPKKTFLRGMDKSIPFRVNLVDGASTVAVDGTFVQRPILSKALARLLALLLLALLALLLLWQFGFKPAIRSEAQDAATEQVKQQLADPATTVPGAPATTEPGSGSPDGGGGAPTTTKGGSGSGAAGGGAGDAAAEAAKGDDGRGGLALTKRVQTDGATVGEFQPSPDATQRFSLTDIVLQNPGGGSGILTIARDDDVLLVSSLDNFRDLDFHVIAPIIVNPGQKVTAKVECAAPDAPCSAAVLFSGFLAPAPAAPTTTTP